MSKRNEYVPGQLINGIVFIKEVERGNLIKRRGIFVCPFDAVLFEATFNNVSEGAVRSCGCLVKVAARRRGSGFKPVHGLTKSHEFKIWCCIKSRCYNENSDAYHNYGGRGITMCDEWIKDFKVFYDYITQLPNYGIDGYTLDREDNDGDYEPGNVRWVDKHFQGANSRPARCGSGYTGVTKEVGGWGVYITFYGNAIRIGQFKSRIESMWARNNFIIENKLFEYPIQEWRG